MRWKKPPSSLCCMEFQCRPPWVCERIPIAGGGGAHKDDGQPPANHRAFRSFVRAMSAGLRESGLARMARFRSCWHIQVANNDNKHANVRFCSVISSLGSHRSVSRTGHSIAYNEKENIIEYILVSVGIYVVRCVIFAVACIPACTHTLDAQ